MEDFAEKGGPEAIPIQEFLYIPPIYRNSYIYACPIQDPIQDTSNCSYIQEFSYIYRNLRPIQELIKNSYMSAIQELRRIPIQEVIYMMSYIRRPIQDLYIYRNFRRLYRTLLYRKILYRLLTKILYRILYIYMGIYNFIKFT